MPLFVLLLLPQVRKFELIQFQRIPEGATLLGLLQQVKQRSSNPEFQELNYVGLYCPKTEQKLLLPTTANDTIEANPNKTSDPETSLTIVVEDDENTDTNIHRDQKKSSCPPATTPKTPKTAPETPQSAATADFPSPGSQAPDHIQTASLPPPIPTHFSTTTTTTTTTTTSTTRKEDGSPVLNLQDLGQLLVAIPEGHKLSHVQKQCDKIISSPAFGILTNGMDLGKSGKTSLQEELEQIQQQKLAKTVSESLSQQQATNLQSNQAYEQQAKDLQARKAKASSPTTTGDANTGGTAATNQFRPDAHGLSPLDQMRVQQNQRKAAEREQKRAAWNPCASKGDVDTMDASATTTPTSYAANVDHSSTPGSFVSPAQAKRNSIQAKKDAELAALRQQGLTQTHTRSPFFTTNSDNATTSPKSPHRIHSLPVKKNRATKTIITTTVNAPLLHEDHVSPTVAGPGVRKLSLQYIPSPGNSASRRSMNNSQSELQELQSLGLAQSVKSKLVQSQQENQAKDEAHAQQQSDLKARRSGKVDRPFQPNASLSAADVQQLEMTKQKHELRQKERETMGYYQATTQVQHAEPGELPSDWKTTGKVLTTVGTAEPSVKEWEAAAQDALVGSKNDNKGASSSAANSKTAIADQGCACIIL